MIAEESFCRCKIRYVHVFLATFFFDLIFLEYKHPLSAFLLAITWTTDDVMAVIIPRATYAYNYTALDIIILSVWLSRR